MKTQIETVNSVKKKITVDLPVEAVTKALEEILEELQKKAEIKGFRKGKVPRNIIEQQFGAEAEKGAVEDLVKKSYPEALKEHNIFPISDPEVTVGPFAKDKPFSYTATFDVKPEVTISEHHGISLEKSVHEVDEEEVEKALKATQQSMTQLEPTSDDAKAEKGMIAFIDFKGTADGKPFKGSEANNFAVDLGGGNFLKEFEEHILGMKKNEKKEISFTYPKEYFNKELCGKKGEFTVLLRELKNKKVPELNDDFAKDLGNYKSINEVRDEIKKRLESSYEHEAKIALSNQAMEHLVKKHQFEVPESMVGSELRYMFDGYVKQLQSQGQKFEDAGISVEQFIEKYKPLAADRVRGYLIIDAISKLENIKVEDADLEKRYEELAAQYGQPAAKIKEYYAKNNLSDTLKFQLLHEKTLDFVVSKAKIKTKKAKKEKK